MKTVIFLLLMVLIAASSVFAWQVPAEVNEISYTVVNQSLVISPDTIWKKVLVVKADLYGLRENSTYLLCLCGKPNQPGNDLLKQYQIWNGEEGYYDFATVNTDTYGRLNGRWIVNLPSGTYHVTFLLKDVSDNYKCVIIDND